MPETGNLGRLRGRRRSRDTIPPTRPPRWSGGSSGSWPANPDRIWATKCPEGTAAGPLMQSRVPLAAPSGQPEDRRRAAVMAIPLIPELQGSFTTCPQPIPEFIVRRRCARLDRDARLAREGGRHRRRRTDRLRPPLPDRLRPDVWPADDRGPAPPRAGGRPAGARGRGHGARGLRLSPPPTNGADVK